MTKITSFRGEHRFLSNFSFVDVTLDGVVYPSTEHAYQASKTLDLAEREAIRGLPTPGQAKRAGRQVTPRPDWEQVKEEIMLDLTRQKYQNPSYKALLLATGQCEIEEGNTWGDTFWGVCRGKGDNRLGKILMRVRTETLGSKAP